MIAVSSPKKVTDNCLNYLIFLYSLSAVRHSSIARSTYKNKHGIEKCMKYRNDPLLIKNNFKKESVIQRLLKSEHACSFA